MISILADVWRRLGGDPAELGRLDIAGPEQTLPARLPVTAAGAAAVGASLLAATLGTGTRLELDTRQLAIALRSERYLRRDGRSAGSPFDPLSAFHRTADGWLRLHANYPWHRAAALRVLGADDEMDTVLREIARWPAIALETALHEAGGVGAAVRSEEQWRRRAVSTAQRPAAAGPEDADQPPRPGPAADPAAGNGQAPADLPLVEHRDLAPAPPRRNVRRLRVLDLTRVIAGPVATRTLAAHGADVLRLDAPHLPEIPMQAWEGLPGKRSAARPHPPTTTPSNTS